MNVAKQPLERAHGLLWVDAVLADRFGTSWPAKLVLDTGTSNTILSTGMARFLGYPKSRKLGTATIETPFGSVDGYTFRLPSITVMKREVRGYLVAAEDFKSKTRLAGILGLDFFEGTDLLLSFRKNLVYLTS